MKVALTVRWIDPKGYIRTSNQTYDTCKEIELKVKDQN